jgi:predicted GTPase
MSVVAHPSHVRILIVGEAGVGKSVRMLFFANGELLVGHAPSLGDIVEDKEHHHC